MYNLFQPASVSFFFCFFFLLFHLTHSCPTQQRETGETMLIFSPLSYPSGGGIPIPGSRKKERRVRRKGHERVERVSKAKQKKSQRRSDYCCGERVWVTSLSRRKDKQVVNAAGRCQENVLPPVSAQLIETILYNSQVKGDKHSHTSELLHGN